MLISKDIESRNSETSNASPSAAGELRGRFVLPISHESERLVLVTRAFSALVGLAFLITGICLWVLGTTPSMVLAGQIMVGLNLGTVGLGLVLCSCALACVGILKLIKKKDPELNID